MKPSILSISDLALFSYWPFSFEIPASILRICSSVFFFSALFRRFSESLMINIYYNKIIPIYGIISIYYIKSIIYNIWGKLITYDTRIKENFFPKPNNLSINDLRRSIGYMIPSICVIIEQPHLTKIKSLSVLLLNALGLILVILRRIVQNAYT